MNGINPQPIAQRSRVVSSRPSLPDTSENLGTHFTAVTNHSTRPSDSASVAPGTQGAGLPRRRGQLPALLAQYREKLKSQNKEPAALEISYLDLIKHIDFVSESICRHMRHWSFPVILKARAALPVSWHPALDALVSEQVAKMCGLNQQDAPPQDRRATMFSARGMEENRSIAMHVLGTPPEERTEAMLREMGMIIRAHDSIGMELLRSDMGIYTYLIQRRTWWIPADMFHIPRSEGLEAQKQIIRLLHYFKGAIDMFVLPLTPNQASLSLFQYAVKMHRFDIAQLLVEQGCDPNFGIDGVQFTYMRDCTLEEIVQLCKWNVELRFLLAERLTDACRQFVISAQAWRFPEEKLEQAERSLGRSFDLTRAESAAFYKDASEADKQKIARWRRASIRAERAGQLLASGLRPLWMASVNEVSKVMQAEIAKNENGASALPWKVIHYERFLAPWLWRLCITASQFMIPEVQELKDEIIQELLQAEENTHVPALREAVTRLEASYEGGDEVELTPYGSVALLFAVIMSLSFPLCFSRARASRDRLDVSSRESRSRPLQDTGR
ncbi:hypothetical protein RGU70_04370 [Herbaspirillum sp. RTI4]|uniref:hypothetical protein n=1 Tax=Herbaspirillum sp. RTI4 TaxID=3048640 RepID=UPI002AB5AFE0|nr:hypothetical protein [Herbaspirillum sp. RTI4]MDY7577555.1 hypothetical protein [Herbaspirillum sp. RTI4]MEA9981030.1 hypothetical protein [Herbaspirillum sp. RTI4]